MTPWLTVPAEMVIVLWVYNGLILKMWFGRRDHPFLKTPRWVWAELRPFYLPAVVVHIVNLSMLGQVLGWNSFFIACTVLNWWLLKDADDDDRWKRRKRKLAEKIERQGARLVAVPVRDGAP